MLRLAVGRRCPQHRVQQVTSSSQHVRAYSSGASDGKKNLYDELGLDSSASAEDIKNAFYDLSKKYHPDLSSEGKGSADKFQAISEAYNLLKDPIERSYYDRRTLGMRSSVADADMHTVGLVRISGRST